MEHSRHRKGSMEQSMKNMENNETPEEKEMTIYLKINKTVALRVKESDSIGDVKSLLHDKEGVPEHFQKLVSNGVELTDEQKLVDYGIIEHSLLDASIANSVLMPFVVTRAYAIGAITVYLRISDTIQDVKDKIEARDGVKLNEFSLIHDGRFLEDDKTLAFYKINGGSMLHMVSKPRDKVLIFVVTLREDIVKMEVNPALTVGDIKTLIESRVGYLTYTVDLFVGKERLEDSKRLYQCGVNDDCVLLVKRKTIQIFVHTSDGRIALDVHRRELVKNVKVMLVKKTRVPVHLQKLIYQGYCLADSRDISCYNIRKESVIMFDVRGPPPGNIYEEPFDMRRFHQTRSPPRTTTIGHLKKLIKKELKLHVKELYMRGKALNDLFCHGITKKKCFRTT